jgi:hypothetical protein
LTLSHLTAVWIRGHFAVDPSNLDPHSFAK